MRARFAPSFAILSLVALSACTEWAAQPLPPAPGPVAIADTRLRVTRTSGEVMELTAGAVSGDSLLGFRAGSAGDPRVSIPLSQVARVEAARANATVPAMIGLGVGAILLRWIILPGLIAD